MPVGNGGIPDEVFEFSPFQVARHNFPLNESAKRSGVTDLAAELNAPDHGLQVFGALVA